MVLGWISDFLHLLYPEVCLGCQIPLVDGEYLLCTACRGQLPVALPLDHQDNKVKDLFFARVPIQCASSLLYYEKIGVVQSLIHQLKYQNQEQISNFLGKWMASALRDEAVYSDIDLVVPVPVHPKRLRQRGYNQVNGFGRELAQGLGARFRESVLSKTRNTTKQAKLGQTERSDETQSPYQLMEQLPSGTHVLLVDDVITTGTTLSLCAKELHRNPDIKVSIATMAVSI
ncbi:ComF family protein [Nonlabens xiamenensis]|uniref:ComF family protein n=1 Tax=Nonlabens xiamenensis TaxID=2341043 RepID=UPI001F0BE4F0|nr:ComF family protein [Nonlabens xiamenensis]